MFKKTCNKKNNSWNIIIFIELKKQTDISQDTQIIPDEVDRFKDRILFAASCNCCGEIFKNFDKTCPKCTSKDVSIV